MPKAQLTVAAYLCAFFAGYGGLAQTSASSACPVRNAPPSAGEIALARGDGPGAVAAFSAEMANSPTSADRAHDGRIRALLAAGRLEDASADADAWVKKAPSSTWAQTSLGQVQLHRGEIPEAFSSFRQASAADRCNAQARAGLARIYALSAMFRSARQLIGSAHELDPVDDEIERQWMHMSLMRHRPRRSGRILPTQRI